MTPSPPSHRQISTQILHSTASRWPVCLLNGTTVSAPFASLRHPNRLPTPHLDGTHQGDRFPSPLFINFAQAVASASSAFLYLLFLSYRDGTLGTRPLSSVLGLHQFSASLKTSQQKPIQGGTSNGYNDGTGKSDERNVKKQLEKASAWRKSLPALLVQVSLFQTLAGPLGFFALRHISYPTMVLGKVSLYSGITLICAVMQARSSHDAQRDTLPAQIRPAQIRGGRLGHDWHQHVHALCRGIKKSRLE